MATINEGSSKTVTVPADQMLTVSTSGMLKVHHGDGMVGDGFVTDVLDAKSQTYRARDHEFTATLEATSGAATYNVKYPRVLAGNVSFNRGTNGNIVSMHDNATGDDVQLGAGEDTSTWSNLPGKPAVIAAGDTEADARAAIGAGTSSLTLGTTASTALAGNYKPAWGDVTGKPAVIAAGDTEADARAAIGAGTSNFSGAYGDLTGAPSIPSSPGDIGAATSAQGAKADTAVQPADLDPYAKTADVATSAQGDLADSAVQPADLSPYAKTADLALANASVAANVATGSTVDDVIAALIAAGLMASA